LIGGVESRHAKLKGMSGSSHTGPEQVVAGAPIAHIEVRRNQKLE
jgi:hypothetical protein